MLTDSTWRFHRRPRVSSNRTHCSNDQRKISSYVKPVLLWPFRQRGLGSTPCSDVQAMVRGNPGEKQNPFQCHQMDTCWFKGTVSMCQKHSTPPASWQSGPQDRLLSGSQRLNSQHAKSCSGQVPGQDGHHRSPRKCQGRAWDRGPSSVNYACSGAAAAAFQSLFPRIEHPLLGKARRMCRHSPGLLTE